MKKFALMIFLISVLLITPCYAEAYDDSSLHNALPDYADGIAGEVGGDTQAGLDRVTEAFTNELSSGFKGAVTRALSIIAIAVICAVLTAFDDKTPEYVSLGGCAAIALISIADVNSFASAGTGVINALSVFSKALLPAMCAASAACGTIGAATVKYAASVLFMDAFVTVSQSVILPLIYAYLAAAVAAAAFKNARLSDIAGLIKKLCIFLMTAVALIFTIYISISSIVASGGDAVASKVAKTAISTALPVVGGIISDAASTVVAGAEAIRNGVGVFGMLALLAVCAAPFALLALNYLTYKLTSAAVRTFGCDRLSELTSSIGSAIGMMLGLAGSCAIILFVSMTISIKAVGG